jgi:hypothetical protein
MSKPVSRRDFVTDAGRLAVGAMILPRHILGGPGYRAPSATLNVACVGIGGMGKNNMERLAAGGENIRGRRREHRRRLRCRLPLR